MADIVSLPIHPRGGGEVFLDARGPERALRVSWHHETDLVVLSLWRGASCTGTFRLPQSDVPALVDALVSGLSTGYDGPTALRRAGAC